MTTFFTYNNSTTINVEFQPSVALLADFENWTAFEDEQIRTLKEFAKKNNLQTTLLVPFDSYYNPGLWNQENIKILASKVQVDLVIFYAINPMFAKLEDNEIYQDLANSLNLKKIMVADNFQDRVCQRLNTLFCKSFWKESCQIVGDFQTKPTPILLIDLLAQAQFKEFKEHSGLDFCFSALVSHGKKLGRQLGFPTINLLTPQRLPLNDGVYACQVKITGVDSLLKGAGFYWKNELDQEVFEINLLDFDQEVYDRKVDVKVIAKIREPIKFTQLEDLKKTLCEDVHQVRKVFNNYEKN
ncbi:riboflavin kinase [Spiroplasma clarkii]|uniref:riboflavin kinase n=1 Tax=Spiroplasma clarkii TaxID=2139 RepID=A0A2K8KL18_9MOLU|nr:riboflavin kinase [Spiroplasma clarkii]ATX70981.1 riboflavin kinase / FMN adenylyltransferase [Spiroplasma clarkii]